MVNGLDRPGPPRTAQGLPVPSLAGEKCLGVWLFWGIQLFWTVSSPVHSWPAWGPGLQP